VARHPRDPAWWETVAAVTGMVYGITKFLSWLLLRLGYGLEVRGQEYVPRHGACIVASNHVSFLDPLVVGAACPRRLTFMARNTLFASPLLRWWLRGVGAISVRRGEADLSAIRSAIQRLRAGEPLALFPEGGRQFSGRLGSAKRGVGLLALTARVPIIPMYVRGTFEALPPQATRLHRAKIRVAFGPAISYTNEPAPAPSQPKGSQPSVRVEESGARNRQEQLAQAVTHAWRRLEEQLNAHD